jgi:acyl-CoA reductase-like NAD-dependent aldehyde dehydrogenase
MSLQPRLARQYALHRILQGEEEIGRGGSMEAARFLVNGTWCDSGKKRQVVNPYTGRSVGEVFQASPGDVDAAIAAAAGAFPRTKTLASFERKAILSQISDAIEAKRNQFAEMITSETGKPITYARGEVDRAVFTFSIAAEEAAKVGGEILPLDMNTASRGRTALVQRFPLGPVGAITPFNFPLNLVAHKVGPAIAAGCPVVLKPSSSAPLTALLLARIITDAGLPEGALNVVPCSGGDVTQLVTDERVKLISFTGSASVGWDIKAKAGMKRVVLELGGNAGVILCEDADIEAAVAKLIPGTFGNAGQSCISVQRIYVHKNVFDDFAARFTAESRKVSVGDPWNEGTVVGPMIDEAAAKKAEEWIQEAQAHGAKILCGGIRKGCVLEPTLLAGVAPEMSVVCQEVFAPVAVLDRFSDINDAIRKVNASSFGLQAAIFTNDARAIFQAFRELEVGGVIVNDSSAYRMDHMPYGGVKQSGFGREGVRFAIEEMTEMKLLALNLP